MQKLNLHDLRNKLNTLCNNLDSNFDINCGGCCLISYLIAQHLDRLGIEYKLIIFDDYRKDITRISYEILNKVKQKRSFESVVGYYTCHHYCLYLTGGGLINKGDLFTHKYIIEGVNSSNIKWIYKMGDWNDCYSINNNRIIKNIIDSFFKNYEKFGRKSSIKYLFA